MKRHSGYLSPKRGHQNDRSETLFWTYILFFYHKVTLVATVGRRCSASDVGSIVDFAVVSFNERSCSITVIWTVSFLNLICTANAPTTAAWIFSRRSYFVKGELSTFPLTFPWHIILKQASTVYNKHGQVLTNTKWPPYEFFWHFETIFFDTSLLCLLKFSRPTWQSRLWAVLSLLF